MVSTPTRTTAARPAAGGTTSGKTPAAGPQGARPPGGRCRHRPRPGPRQPSLPRGCAPGTADSGPRWKARQVPQRIHLLPGPRLHPGADGDRHHDGPLRLQRGGDSRGGVTVLRRPQTGRIRRDRRVRACLSSRASTSCGSGRFAWPAHAPGHCAAGSWSSLVGRSPWATRTGSTSVRSPSSPPKPPSLPSRCGWRRCLTARQSSSTNGATPSFPSWLPEPLRSWDSSSPETTSARR